jgi:hypothetical protein
MKAKRKYASTAMAYHEKYRPAAMA